MLIGITYNLKTEIPPSVRRASPEDAFEEFDLPETIEAIREVLTKEGHQVFLLGSDLKIIDKIKRNRIQFVFNLAEGYSGRNREAEIPALLEQANIPYSGSDPLGLSATLDKSIAKHTAISIGVPTPEFWVLKRPEDRLSIPPQFPFFVKPLWEGSSKGIRLSSKVSGTDEFERETARLFNAYPDVPILVERYIPGREFTVGVIGNKPPEILGIMEIAFQDEAKKDFCYSLEVKRNWKKEVQYIIPPSIDPFVQKAMEESALRLFQTLGLRDVARFDFRLNPEGKFYFLEVNPLPGLSPESGDLVILAQKLGINYHDLIMKIARCAFARYPFLPL